MKIGFRFGGSLLTLEFLRGARRYVLLASRLGLSPQQATGPLNYTTGSPYQNKATCELLPRGPYYL